MVPTSSAMHLGCSMDDESALRAQICSVGASLYNRGYVHGTTGNISVRLRDGYLITPTDACLGELDSTRLARLNAAGVHVSGDRASKSIALHRQIYGADPAANCVLHTHSREIVAASFGCHGHHGNLLPPITPYQVMKVGPTPVVRYLPPGSSQAAEEVGALVAAHQSAGQPLRSVTLMRLGPVAWHSTLAGAMAVLEELEETALLWNRLRPEALTDQALAELSVEFGVTW